MNSQFDKTKSMEELKDLNRRDLTIAAQTEPCVTLTERNWKAVISLLNGLLLRQEQMEEIVGTLMTAGDAEEVLRQIAASQTNLLKDLNQRVQSCTAQAGNLSESFSTGADTVTKASEKAIRSLTHTARTWIILTAVTSMASTMLLALLQLLL